MCTNMNFFIGVGKQYAIQTGTYPVLSPMNSE